MPLSGKEPAAEILIPQSGRKSPETLFRATNSLPVVKIWVTSPDQGLLQVGILPSAKECRRGSLGGSGNQQAGSNA